MEILYVNHKEFTSIRSFTPWISVTATMIVRCLKDFRLCNADSKPSLKAIVVCFVLGTRCFLRSSFAACSDHAMVHGRSAIHWKTSGDGPTVEMVTLLCAKLNLSLSDKHRTAEEIDSMFLPGVYICKSIVNYLRHGNYICKSEVNVPDIWTSYWDSSGVYICK